MKRILPSVPLFVVLVTMLLNSSIQYSEAQSYKKGAELNDSLVISTQKRTFKRAGDKLLTIEIAKDTLRKTQGVTVRLLNPDFTVFRTFYRELPIDKFVMFFHNGIDVIENIENDKPVYYWRYTCETEDQNIYFDETTVLNESNDSLYSFPVSFHGARMIEGGEKLKITGEHITNDTIYFDIDGWHGWKTMQIMTGSIYDLKTGILEYTFPTGTTFRQVAVIDDTARILTDNMNMSLLTNKHPFGSEATCMRSTIYNLDYSVYKELDYNFSSMGINLSNLNYSSTYEPLYDGHNLYFLHSFESYIRDNQGGVLGYSNRYFLTDKNGTLLKMVDNPTNRAATALWLPSKNKTVFVNYNGVVLSCPEMDSIGTFTDYAIKENGFIIFAKVMDDSVKLLNEQLNVIGSFPALSNEWRLSDFSQHKVVADSLMELVFINNNNGTRVLNEKGQVLVDEPDSTWKMDFMDYTPIFLMNKGHKYANLVDDSLGLWYRVAPLRVQVMQNKTLLPLSLQVYRQANDSIFKVDSAVETGVYEGLLPEGSYIVRTVSDNLPSTYFPSSLLWEDASPVAFTTDSLPVLTINQPANPQSLLPANEGSITGTLTCNQPALLWAIDQNQQVRVYAVQSGVNTVVAVDSLSNMKFALNHLPYGTYDVLVDIPGQLMLTKNTCVLSSSQKQVGVAFSLSYNGISGNVITGLSKPTSDHAFSIVPNPASDRIRFNASFEGCSIELFDMAGRSVLSSTIQGGEVRINQLLKGLYMVRVQSKDGLLRSMLKKD